VPVPFSSTLSAAPNGSALVTVRLAAVVSSDDGTKRTWISHVLSAPLGPVVPVQLSVVSKKSSVPEPTIWALEIVTWPPRVTVKLVGAVAQPTGWPPCLSPSDVR
jgi:hypothetical protein